MNALTSADGSADKDTNLPKERTLVANVIATALAPYTYQAMMAAGPRGTIVWDASGDPALEIDGRQIGGGLDEPSRQHVTDRLGDNKEMLVVVFGIGSGQVPRQIRGMTSGGIVIYEPDPGILRTLFEAGPTDLGGIPIIADRTELQIRWMQLAQDCKGMSLVITPGYEDLYPEELKALGTLLRESIVDSALVDNTRRARYQEWLKNVFTNLPVLQEATPILSLAGKYKGVPAFIIGAGPSLDKNIHLVREAATKGIVFSVDVAGRALARVGTEPQVLVCLEGLNLSHLMADLPFIDRVIRAFSLAAHPDSLATGKGPLLPFHEGIPPFVPIRELVGAPPVGVGGSVSTVAYSIAEQLGCDPIVFVGQDLAFTGGRTHGAGTPFGESRATVSKENETIQFAWSKEISEVYKRSTPKLPDPRERVFHVTAWGGEGEVATTAAFSAFRQWFEIAAVRLAKIDSTRRLINATEGGSRIGGYEERTLREVLDDLPVLNISTADLVHAARDGRTPVTQLDISKWARKHARAARLVEEAAKRVWKTAVRAEATLDSANHAEITRLFAELGELEAELSARCADAPFAEAWTYAEVDAAKKQTDKRPSHGDIVDDARWGLLREAAIAKALATSARALHRELISTARRNRTATTTRNSVAHSHERGSSHNARTS